MTATAVCRGCGKALRGRPYHMGGSAYDPVTNERCPSNFYGGYVCSESCDRRACRELESTMPGHGPSDRQASLSCYAEAAIKRNWSKP